MSSLRDRRRFSVLVVSHSYPPVLGGSEIEAQRVCSALLRRGHKVTVLCAGGPPMPDVSFWIDPAGVPVRLYGRHRLTRDYAFALGVARTLLREGRRQAACPHRLFHRQSDGSLPALFSETLDAGER